VRIGFLASGRGSNMQAVISACESGVVNAVPAVLISNNSSSGAIEYAKSRNIPSYHLSSLTHPMSEDLDRAMLDTFVSHKADLIMCVGYMKKLGPATLKHYRSRILNIHPALLPKFGGQGMYGMNVHRAVMDSGEKITGVTIHIVTEEYDSGPILAQAKVPVEEGDTAESLAARVLKREHSFIVETLQRIVSGDIALPSME